MSETRTAPSNRQLTTALLAHVVLCLALAPVAAARQAAQQEPVPAGKPLHNGGDSTSVQAAFDASNVRPEEDADGQQKKGKSRSDSGRRKAALRHFDGRANASAGREAESAGVSDQSPQADDAPAGPGADEGALDFNDRPHANFFEPVGVINRLDGLAADEIRFLVSRLNAGNPAAQPVGPPLLL
jgi:hypothetical protein